MMSHKQQPIQDKTWKNFFKEILGGYVLTLLAVICVMNPYVLDYLNVAGSRDDGRFFGWGIPECCGLFSGFFSILYAIYAVIRVILFGIQRSRNVYVHALSIRIKYFVLDYVMYFYLFGFLYLLYHAEIMRTSNVKLGGDYILSFFICTVSETSAQIITYLVPALLLFHIPAFIIQILFVNTAGDDIVFSRTQETICLPKITVRRILFCRLSNIRDELFYGLTLCPIFMTVFPRFAI